MATRPGTDGCQPPGIFTAIGEKALSAEEVSLRCHTHPRSTEMLLNACAALGILEKEGNLFRNSPEALESLVRGKPAYIGDAIAHQEDFMGTLGYTSPGGTHQSASG